MVLGAAVVVAVTAAVLAVTLHSGARGAAARSTHRPTTTTSKAADTPSTTALSAGTTTVTSSPVRSSPGSGTAAPSPKATSPAKSEPTPSTTVTSPSPGLSSAAPCTPVTAPGGAYAVGDSVMLDAQQPLQQCVSNIQVNAAVSRQWSDGETILQEVMAGPAPPAVVVVALGTNGPITDADFDAMMSILQGASRVVFVTVHVDQPWQDQVNGVLASGVSRYPKAVLADWESLAAQHPEWFYSDGTHLPIGGPGAQALAALIASKV